MSEIGDIQELFDRAVALPDGARRAFVLHSDYLPVIQSAVLKLLEHYDEDTQFLEHPAIETFSALSSGALGQIGEFRLVRELGRGGMGVVYLAEDVALDRSVALKVLGSHLTGSPTAIRRFRREAKAAARLRHPAIVRVYRYGEDSGVHFIAMEFVEGETLEHRLRTLRTPTAILSDTEAKREPDRNRPVGAPRLTATPEYVKECLRVTALVALGLDAAHQAGVIHCDVKPSNILLDSGGQPHITDFGIARLGAVERLTKPGDLAGSLHYMSPEQLACGELDRRTDVFSLGVVLYEMLTLTPPFFGEDLPSVLDSVRSTEPRPITQLNPAVSIDLQTICRKALEKKPADRYPTTAHMAADLQCHLRGEPIMARPPSTARRLTRWFARRRTQSLVGAVAVLLASLAVAGTVQIRNHYSAMASVSIDVNPATAGSNASLRRWSSASQAYGALEFLGGLPLVEAYIEPGSYRFAITSGVGLLAEFDAVLVPGEARSVLLPVVDVATVAEDMVEFRAADYILRPVRWMTTTDDQSFHLEGFALDRFEVSNERYKAFIDQTGYPAPEHWKRFGYDAALARRPVVGVTREDAEAFARWCGKRLPTSAEWEAAARSPDGRLLPWGAGVDPPSSALPTYERLLGSQARSFEELYAEYVAGSVDIDADPAPHGENGIAHLFGNVMELTSTVMDHDTSYLVLRGGYWAHHPRYFTLREAAISPRDVPALNAGFRCARSLAP